MIASRFSLLLVPIVLLMLMLASSAATAPPPAPAATCSPGSSNCFDWHRESVTVSWSHPGCPATTISSDTGGTPVSCTASNAEGSTTTTVNVRKDSTAPSVRGAMDRGPDNNGWYNHGVAVNFSGADGLSGVMSCTSATYSGPDSGNASVSGSCRDWAGNVGQGSVTLRYDATAPSVVAKADRPPNTRGWYNRSVTVAFVGSDAVAGVDACDPPVQYKGPDAPKATLSGTCRDKAANKSPPTSFDLKYDTRPPKLGRVRAEITRTAVVLNWTASMDTYSVVVVRRPGLRGPKPSTLYNKRGRTFTDRRLKSGVKYRYTVTAYDEAENGAAKALQVQATSSIAKPARMAPVSKTPALLSPAAGARLLSPPRLSWTAVAKASYYNVQLYRNGRKILTAWPTDRSFRLHSTWRYGGSTYRLTPGLYRWYVWPGFGARSANRYGKLLGTRSFAVIGA